MYVLREKGENTVVQIQGEREHVGLFAGLRLATLNVNGWTFPQMQNERDLMEILGRVDVLVLQDTRLDQDGLRGFKKMLQARQTESRVVVGAELSGKQRDKMTAYGGTLVIARGRWANAVRDWGADTVTGVGLFTWVRFQRDGKAMTILTMYQPIAYTEGQLQIHQHAVRAKAQKNLRQHLNQEADVDSWLQEQIEEIIRRHTRDNAIEFIIAGDFNCDAQKARGWLKIWADKIGATTALQRTGMNVIAKERLYTFEAALHRSVPDNVLMIGDFQIQQIQVERDAPIITNSDHFMLSVSLACRTSEAIHRAQGPTKTIRHQSIDIPSTDPLVERFQEEIGDEPRIRGASESGDEYLEWMHTEIVRAAKAVNGRPRTSQRNKDGWSPAFMTWKAWLVCLIQCRRACMRPNLGWIGTIQRHVLHFQQVVAKYHRDAEAAAARNAIHEKALLEQHQDREELRSHIELLLKCVRRRCHGRERRRL